MKELPQSLQSKLKERKQNKAFRTLSVSKREVIDFYSNDYLGFSKNKKIADRAEQILQQEKIETLGATGSRLISGNSAFYEKVEQQIANFHQEESALIFNSGYTANLGLLSCVPQKNDVILYDELSHASIRDGILLSNAKAYKFKHNNTKDLESKISKFKPQSETIYVVTESVFSMDGDQAPLETLVKTCLANQVYLIIDEAHALGVYGRNGVGLVQKLNLQNQVFARVITYGKALGCHGAVILGNKELRDYLINFARSFIYTTALPPHHLTVISAAYQELGKTDALIKLKENISYFKKSVSKKGLTNKFIESNSAIQSFIIPGNEQARNLAEQIQAQDMMVKAILSPTVPQGKERIRICLHSFNTSQEIDTLLDVISSNL
ncbi:pyridoxal phosphate-dependent aminotransferase family protein [Mesonia sp. K7]|uniref:aminotransferase class I/II-fold pyridoxal phosphate-dependent enzyme n=1 Tax=Mesonia sp. K7 TaxID=2218606 RepID=UPI000DA88CE9|nr:pyridoxal phosphate-dependent aminotransferase family protein [Mesonia sp. K7]PZD78973.1 8-amino-7-oxononanoate synthase [Mesonia sp. K7]